MNPSDKRMNDGTPYDDAGILVCRRCGCLVVQWANHNVNCGALKEEPDAIF